jgi:hypothetical protein
MENEAESVPIKAMLDAPNSLICCGSAPVALFLSRL